MTFCFCFIFFSMFRWWNFRFALRAAYFRFHVLCVWNSTFHFTQTANDIIINLLIKYVLCTFIGTCVCCTPNATQTPQSVSHSNNMFFPIITYVVGDGFIIWNVQTCFKIVGNSGKLIRRKSLAAIFVAFLFIWYPLALPMMVVTVMVMTVRIVTASCEHTGIH